MRGQVVQKLDRLPLKYFDGLPRGELLSRVTNDLDNVASSLQTTLSQMVQSVLTVIGILVMMLTVSPLLTLVALASVPISILVAGLVMARSQKKFMAMWKTTGELNGQVEEAYTGHSIVTVFSRRKEVLAEFRAKNQEMYEASFGAQFISGLIMPIMMLVGNLAYVVIAVVGCLRVASGHITLGDVQAFIQYSRQFSQPVNQLASMTNLLQSGVASAERVFEVLDVAEEGDQATAELAVPAAGRVVFDHVEFAYDPAKPLIGDLSLVAEPGQTIAIVGPTGAGKTTLVNLLMRFYDVQGGAITLDGTDITTVPRHQLRDQFGMVLQETWLFHGTIRENIAYGRPGATEDQILAAAKATYVDRFVRSLPDGYDTVIDEEASNVSAGEKQLLTIARAFLSEPSILILDEATSSVDTRTEVLIQKAMGRLRKGRTSFVIAHRLSTIRDADLILVMEHGDIVEQGTHAQLLAAKGPYFDLYQTQFTAGKEEDPVVAAEVNRAQSQGLF
jgi:ATP-binding cassette subfamily B protein